MGLEIVHRWQKIYDIDGHDHQTFKRLKVQNLKQKAARVGADNQLRDPSLEVKEVINLLHYASDRNSRNHFDKKYQTAISWLERFGFHELLITSTLYNQESCAAAINSFKNQFEGYQVENARLISSVVARQKEKTAQK